MATVDKMTTGQLASDGATIPATLVPPTIDQATLMRDVLLLIAEPLGAVEKISARRAEKRNAVCWRIARICSSFGWETNASLPPVADCDGGR